MDALHLLSQQPMFLTLEEALLGFLWQGAAVALVVAGLLALIPQHAARAHRTVTAARLQERESVLVHRVSEHLHGIAKAEERVDEPTEVARRLLDRDDVVQCDESLQQRSREVETRSRRPVVDADR